MLKETYERMLAKFGPDAPGTKNALRQLQEQEKRLRGRSAAMALRRGFTHTEKVENRQAGTAETQAGGDDRESKGVVSEVRQAMDRPWPREATGKDGQKYRLAQTGVSSWQISVLTKKNRWKRDVCGGLGVIQYWGRRQREAGDIQLPRKLGIFLGGGEYKIRRSLNVEAISIESQDRLTDDSGGPGRSRLCWSTTRVDVWIQADGTFKFQGSRESPGYSRHSFSGPGGLRSLDDLLLAMRSHAVRIGVDDRRVLEVIRQIWLDRRAEEKARLSSGADQPDAE